MTTDDTTTAQPPEAPRPPRRLYRSRRDKVVAGVAGGLAEYLGVDPVIVRIAFVVLTVAGGSGILLYILGWLLLPEEGKGGAAYQTLFHRRPLLAWGLVGLGALMLFDDFGWGHDHDFPWALALIGVGVAVLIAQRRRDGDGGSDPASGEEMGAALATDDARGPDTDWIPALTPEPPRPSRPRSVLTPVTLSLLMIGAGVASLVGVTLQAYLAAALILTGMVLLIGSRVGQARGLVVVGLLLTAAATAASVTDVSFAGGVGERSYRPRTAAQVRTAYRLGVGEMVLDLSDVDLRTGRTDVRARLGVGQLTVIVPDNVHVEVDAHVGLGQVDVFGRKADGSGLDRRFTRDGGETSRRLVLDLDAGIGEIEVEVDRAAA
jgi:phage shock protein PspC (stress-responsive transcriptional regulator)